MIVRVAGIALSLALCAPPHLLLRLARLPSPFPRWFLGWAGWWAGLRVECRGRPLKRHVLYAANHVSWLDILALGGATGAVFVSRADVAGWPVMGPVARLHDTIFVDRAARREVHGQADSLRRALNGGAAVALFPEGTTEGGHEILPFRPSLFASLFPALPHVQVQPVAVDYGALAPDIAWAGAEPAGANAKRILSRRGTIRLTLHFLAPVDPHEAGDRKALAARAQAEVSEILQPSGEGHPPLYGRR